MGKFEALLVEIWRWNLAIVAALWEPSLSIIPAKLTLHFSLRDWTNVSHSPASLDEQKKHLCGKIFYDKNEKTSSVQVILKTIDPLI